MLIPVPGNPVNVVRRAFWLAFQASSPLGMGFLHTQAANAATESDVWAQVETDEWTGQRRESPYGDYVFGRMMKTGLKYTSDEVLVTDNPPRHDYQSWCRHYPTYEALVEAAVKSLESEKLKHAPSQLQMA